MVHRLKTNFHFEAVCSWCLFLDFEQVNADWVELWEQIWKKYVPRDGGEIVGGW